MADFRVGMSSFPPVDIGVSTNKNGRLRRFNVKGQMWSGRGSNPRPRTCKARALPTELPPQVSPSFSEEPIDCTSFGPCCKGRSHAALRFRGFAEFPRGVRQLFQIQRAQKHQPARRPNQRAVVLRKPLAADAGLEHLVLFHLDFCANWQNGPSCS